MASRRTVSAAVDGLDVYSHVMPPHEIASERFLSLLAASR
jgi:hypothetical protein